MLVADCFESLSVVRERDDESEKNRSRFFSIKI